MPRSRVLGDVLREHGDAVNPHEILTAYVRERTGAYHFAERWADLFDAATQGIVEQLAVYCDLVPSSRIRADRAVLREGFHRDFVMIRLYDRGKPLRLRDATERWAHDTTIDTDSPNDFVWRVNARRWRFVERHWHQVIEPVVRSLGECLNAYWPEGRKGKLPRAGQIRLLEDVDATFLTINLEHDAPRQNDVWRSDHLVQ